MNVVNIILHAAKIAKVSGVLLLRICSHESNNFQFNYNAHDKGSPSYGVCQIKEATARQFGFTGKANALKNPKISALYAARYLAYQESVYGNFWVKMTAAYNSGRYNPSNRILGCPRNLQYIRLVQKKLPDEYKDRLNCGDTELARNK